MATSLESKAMDERTLTALQGSIAKWEAIVAGTGKDGGPLNCPLCREFHPDYRTDHSTNCEGCPIATAGFAGCANEEYEAFCRASDRLEMDGEDNTAATRMHAAAIGELAFLKTLLPEAQS